MSQFIAIDIGGTQMRAARFTSGKDTPDRIERISTHHPTEIPLDRLYSLVDRLVSECDRLTAIGVAAPGPVDPYAGVIREAPNVTGWKDFPLQKLLSDRYQVPVALGNDANLAALGEWKFGAGRGYHHLIYVTVSTGIGGGVIVADRLLVGVKGLAAELGHLTVVPDGPTCGCGHKGHLEAVASGPALVRWVKQEIAQGIPTTLETAGLTAKAIGQAALAGDELARAAIARSGTYLGQALADYLHIFNPDLIIIGGGVSQTGALLLDPLRQTLQERVLSPYYLEGLQIVSAALGDNAGLVGALALAQGLSEAAPTAA